MPAMIPTEDTECPVCFLTYTRTKRIPRILHCQHTFCVPCLQVLTRLQDSVMTVRCPLCRWITCTPSTLTLSGSLWVNTSIWDQLAPTVEQDGEMCEWAGTEVTHSTPSERKTGWKTKLCQFLKNLQDIPHNTNLS